MQDLFLYDILIHVTDSLFSYPVLVFFIFTSLDEKIRWRVLLKLELLAALPLGIVNYFFQTVTGHQAVLAYVLSSIVVFVVSTAHVSSIWKYDLWRAASIVGIAAILQVSIAAVVDTPLEYLIFNGSENSRQVFWRLHVIFIMYLVITWAISVLLRKMHFGRPIRYLLEDGQHIRLTTVEVLALEITVEIFFTLRWGMNQASLFTYSAAIIILALLVLVILIYLSSREESTRKLQLQEAMLLQQQMYVEHLEDMQREVRRFRHDYKNMLSGMYLHVKEGEVEKIGEMLENLEIDFDHKIGEKIFTATQIGNIRIPELKSLVLSKLTKMDRERIACGLEVLYPIERVGMDIWDFNRCLGILLDNAIEAAATHETPCIELQMLCHGGFLTVRVSNPWEGEEDVSRLGKEGYSTKGAGRGLGLANYRRILAKYPDAMSVTSCGNHRFVQELTIPIGN